jgi:Tfp pilus assembly protein PilV
MRLIHKVKRGDTLIEVMLAFAILSAVIGTAFSGAMGSYRSGITAQNRTQALFLAQYQADGLKTYRDSLDWDKGGGLPSFLDGPSGTLGASLVPIKNANGIYLSNFCMSTDKATPSSVPYWKIVTDVNTCNALAKSLAPNLINPTISISTSQPSGTADRVEAIVTVSYKAANANITEKVTNSIILTK